MRLTAIIERSRLRDSRSTWFQTEPSGKLRLGRKTVRRRLQAEPKAVVAQCKSLLRDLDVPETEFGNIAGVFSRHGFRLPGLPMPCRFGGQPRRCPLGNQQIPDM
jgi:hypothetical protein